ncbi:glycosyltransferase [Williamsia muralis]|uniref:glycosyltransferase n=1 Tax=Williamsia marianensis TaxID=85044 RepID=UPI003811BA36
MPTPTQPARILFVTFDAGGNFPPVITLGREFARRGHHVTVLGHAQQRRKVEAAGFEFIAYSNAPSWSSSRHKSTASTLWGYLALFTTRTLVADAVAASREADLVVVDCMLLPVMSALNALPQPTIALFHAYYAYLDGPWRRGPIGVVARLRGLSSRQIWGSTDLQVVVSDQALDPAGRHHRAAGNIFWAGPAEPAARPLTPRTPPTVLASLSTTYFPAQQQTMQNILDAAATLPIQLIATTGPAIDPSRLRVPANAELHEYVPHADVLPDCVAVIGHGGHSTTFQALAHGLPLIVMPMHPLLDQPMVGRSVVRAGAGMVLPKKASAARIASALSHILDEPGYSASAQAIGDRLASGDGTTRAVDRMLAELP